jgi:hypothetical protein
LVISNLTWLDLDLVREWLLGYLPIVRVGRHGSDLDKEWPGKIQGNFHFMYMKHLARKKFEYGLLSVPSSAKESSVHFLSHCTYFGSSSEPRLIFSCPSCCFGFTYLDSSNQL